MADYVDTLLIPGEKIVFETRMSWFVYAAWFFLALIIAVCVFYPAAGTLLPGWLALLMGLACFGVAALWSWLLRKSSEFVATNRRVIMKTGIIGRNVFEMRLEKIESIDLRQSIPGRLFNFGTVVVHGTGDTARKFEMIEEPGAFRKAVANAAAMARTAWAG